MEKHLTSILHAQPTHATRLNEFHKLHYLRDKYYLIFLTRRYWIYDRLTQLYHFFFLDISNISYKTKYDFKFHKQQTMLWLWSL